MKFILIFFTFFTFSSFYAQNYNEIIKAVASDRASADNFGYSVAISGNTAIVGAFQEDEDANGAYYTTGAGSAYIFEKNTSGNWVETQKIVASDRASNDYFGASVAISGNTIIVGALREDEDVSWANYLTDAGSAYIFEKNTSGNWVETQKIVASDRASGVYFGTSVAISGNTIIVGAFREDKDASGANYLTDAGSAYIFEKNTSGNWVETQKIVNSDRAYNDLFGYSVAISGNTIIVGAYKESEDVSGANTLNLAGSAYIFEKNTSGN